MTSAQDRVTGPATTPAPTETSGKAGSGRRVGLALAAGGLLVVLDTTITIVALPQIVAELDTSLPTAQWITTGYLLAIVAVIPLAGWAANTFGARRVYLLALSIFVVASAGCALAPGIGALIAFRAVQGIGGGLINPIGQAIGLRAVPRRARGRMMALIGLPVVIGPVLGPPISGWLVTNASWRWVFAINIPLGVAAVVVCLALLPRTRREPAQGLDITGLLLLPTGAVSLVLAATLIGDRGALTPTAAAVGGLAVALLGAFTLRALRIAHPLLNLHLLRQRALASNAGVLVCFSAAYFGAMSLLPIVVQGVRGDSALTAGLLTIPQAIATGITLQVATRAVDRTDPRRIVLTGVTLGLIGSALLLLAVTSSASYPLIAVAAVVLGIGSGATLMPAMTLATRDLRDAQTPQGTTLLALTQQLAAALGTAVVTAAVTINVTDTVPALRGGLQAMLSLDAATRAGLETFLSHAVGATYAVVVALMLLAVITATLTAGNARAHQGPS